MIKIITLEREYGSGAPTVAQLLANRLGWALWDHEITCEIARRLKCTIESVEQREERLDSTYYRLMKTFMRGSYEGSLQSQGLELLDAESLAILFERIAKDIAGKGNCVIVGRGAPWFLRDREDAFHVFLYASYEEKIRRIKAVGKKRSEAEHLIDTVDHDRAAFVKKYYGKDWPDRHLYHLMINTKIGDELVVTMILREVELLNEQAAGVQTAS
jgi:cytidylate kinase